MQQHEVERRSRERVDTIADHRLDRAEVDARGRVDDDEHAVAVPHRRRHRVGVAAGGDHHRVPLVGDRRRDGLQQLRRDSGGDQRQAHVAGAPRIRDAVREDRAVGDPAGDLERHSRCRRDELVEPRRRQPGQQRVPYDHRCSRSPASRQQGALAEHADRVELPGDVGAARVLDEEPDAALEQHVHAVGGVALGEQPAPGGHPQPIDLGDERVELLAFRVTEFGQRRDQLAGVRRRRIGRSRDSWRGIGVHSAISPDGQRAVKRDRSRRRSTASGLVRLLSAWRGRSRTR